MRLWPPFSWIKGPQVRRRPNSTSLRNNGGSLCCVSVTLASSPFVWLPFGANGHTDLLILKSWWTNPVTHIFLRTVPLNSDISSSDCFISIVLKRLNSHMFWDLKKKTKNVREISGKKYKKISTFTWWIIRTVCPDIPGPRGWIWLMLVLIITRLIGLFMYSVPSCIVEY